MISFSYSILPNVFLRVTLDEQEDELEVSNCLYSGTISGFPGGTAALSACDGDNGFVIYIDLHMNYKNTF
jgi:hypothetical protein